MVEWALNQDEKYNLSEDLVCCEVGVFVMISIIDSEIYDHVCPRSSISRQKRNKINTGTYAIYFLQLDT